MARASWLRLVPQLVLKPMSSGPPPSRSAIQVREKVDALRERGDASLAALPRQLACWSGADVYALATQPGELRRAKPGLDGSVQNGVVPVQVPVRVLGSGWLSNLSTSSSVRNSMIQCSVRSTGMARTKGDVLPRRART